MQRKKNLLQARRKLTAVVEVLESRRLLSGYTLHTLAALKSGVQDNVTGQIVEDGGGNLFFLGVSSPVASTFPKVVFELARGSSTPTVLASFPAGYSQSGEDLKGLAMDPSGNLFAVAPSGGPTGVGSGDGVLFEVAHGSGTVTTLASFTSATTGSGPADVVSDSSGNLFGVTENGGAGNDGTIWEVAAGSTTITVLASFPHAFPRSFGPGGLVIDSHGNLFGTNNNTVWELAQGSSTITTLATFALPAASDPQIPLVVDSGGNVFGETTIGGPGYVSGASQGNGTIFEIPAGTQSPTTLVNFNGTDGDEPQFGLVADSTGNLFGITRDSGPLTSNGYSGGPLVFELAKGATSTTALATLTAAANGITPLDNPLFVDSSGNIFGSTFSGGPQNGGTIFELTPGGSGGGGGGGGGTVSSVLSATLSGKVSTKPAVPGHKFTLSQTVTVTDNSSSAVTGTVSAAMFLSTGNTVDSSSIQIASGRFKIKLKPHKHSSFVLRASRIPSTVTANTYFLVVQFTDPSGVTGDVASSSKITIT